MTEIVERINLLLSIARKHSARIVDSDHGVSIGESVRTENVRDYSNTVPRWPDAFEIVR